ncbi:hypothetical protein ITP53_14630 [Nonomuraea sp. K274]|uniref:Uncharacterized protein n=1 Tax=Nonomuraea cypriaca TaxID=1187855 RepID=A0A931A965_9ACTN|nr:hypothetical protein [Nonomuraea cypriaca]MBF8186954.1 hypothetical protein [Nonomuraea cypriaca]
MNLHGDPPAGHAAMLDEALRYVDAAVLTVCYLPFLGGVDAGDRLCLIRTTLFGNTVDEQAAAGVRHGRDVLGELVQALLFLTGWGALPVEVFGLGDFRRYRARRPESRIASASGSSTVASSGGGR